MSVITDIGEKIRQKTNPPTVPQGPAIPFNPTPLTPILPGSAGGTPPVTNGGTPPVDNRSDIARLADTFLLAFGNPSGGPSNPLQATTVPVVASSGSSMNIKSIAVLVGVGVLGWFLWKKYGAKAG